MGNLFNNLPAPVSGGNGVGVAVDLSTYGEIKTFIVDGTWVLPPSVSIEMNNDPGQSGSWVAVTPTFQGAGRITTGVVGMWFRMRVSGYHSGMSPDVNVGGTDDGTTILSLPVPANNGVGAPVDISSLGPYKTVVSAGDYKGSVIVEFSTDGTTEWAQNIGFPQSAAQSAVMVAHWARVRRVGIPTPSTNVGLPIVTIGAANPAGSATTAITAISGGTTIGTGPIVAFANSNGVSFGMSGNTMTASAAAPTPFAISASASSAGSGTVVFSNSNGFSFGMNGNTITLSASGRGVAAGTQTALSGTAVFSNSNNVSFGMLGSSVITASASFAQSTQPAPAAISAAGSSASSGTVVFANGNGVSFGMNGQTVTASVAAGGALGAISAGTQSAGTGTIVFSNSNNVSFGMQGSSVITASFSQSVAGPAAIAAGTQTATGGTIVFSNSGPFSFGMSNSSVVTFSLQPIRIGVTNLGNTAGTTGLGNGQASNTYLLIATGPLTMSQSLAGNGNVTLTIVASGASASYMQGAGQFASLNPVSNAAMSLYRYATPHYATLTQLRLILRNDFTTVGVTDTITVSAGLYTMSGSTASLASSMSQTVTVDLNNPAFSSAPAMVGLSGFTFTVIPTDYLVAMWIRNSATNSNVVQAYGLGAVPVSTMLNTVGTQNFLNGYSNSSFTTAMPSSIHISNTNYARVDATANRQPSWQFLGS